MSSSGRQGEAGYDVAIVGGGFAGAVAGRELARTGRRVVLLEARDRLGGRTWMKPAALAGLDLEMGGTWIDPRQHHSWAEAHRYGAAVGPSAYGEAPINLWLVKGVLRRSRIPLAAAELAELEHVLYALWDGARRIDPARPLAGQGVDDLDVPLGAFLRSLRVGPHAYEVAAVFLRTYGSAYEDDISLLHLLRRLAAAGSMTEFTLSGASHPLLEGTGRLLERIVAEAPFEIRLSCPVQRLEQDGADVVVRTAAGSVAARSAVVTVPPSALRGIEFEPGLPPERAALADEGLASRGLKLWAVARNVPDDLSACGPGPGLDSLWSTGRTADGDILLVGYGPDARELDGNDPGAVEQAVRVFVPGAEITASTSHDWARDPYSLVTWDVFRPGQLARLDGALRAPSGRVVFAGSYTACSWPGFIDGAIESGYRAAADVARVLA